MYSAKILRFVSFRVSDSETAKDLTTDTFVRFLKVLDKGEKIGNTKALLYRIARGLIIDFYRKDKKTKTVSIDEIDEKILSYDTDFVGELAKKQEIETVYKSLSKMKKNYREVLLLYYVDELGVEEISIVMNKSENYIRVLIHRAIIALKEKL